MQGGGLTGGIRLEATLQVTSPNNRATLTSAGFPAGGTASGVLMRSTELAVGAPPIFGDGVLCVASPVVRIGAGAGFGGGFITSTFGHGAMAGSGDFHYQFWYRETPISYCDPAAAFSTSNGVTLTW